MSERNVKKLQSIAAAILPLNGCCCSGDACTGVILVSSLAYVGAQLARIFSLVESLVAGVQAWSTWRAPQDSYTMASAPERDCTSDSMPIKHASTSIPASMLALDSPVSQMMSADSTPTCLLTRPISTCEVHTDLSQECCTKSINVGCHTSAICLG